MIEIENGCVDCGLPCIYEACRFYAEVHMYCDKCGNEERELYHWDGQHWCADCILESLERVECDD